MRVLVIDDSLTMRRLIRRELEAAGYEVVEATTGTEALVILAGAPVDLITLDVDMPVMNGFETCELIRKKQLESRSPRIPILFFTTLDTVPDRMRGFKSGATEFLNKNFSKGELVSVINSILKPAKKFNGLTALVVDDSETSLQIVRAALEGQGLKVLTAANGAEALETLKEVGTTIDLLVTDQHMPGLSGEELCKKARIELGLKDIPIILISADCDRASVLHFFKVGASDYLIKPFLKEEFLARIVVHLETRLLHKHLIKKISELEKSDVVKDEFLAACSHDLRSPLNGVLGHTELLLEKTYLTEDDKKGLRQVKNASLLLLELVNNILDVTQMQLAHKDLKMSEVSLSDIVGSCVNAFHNIASPKGIELKFIDKTNGSSLISGNLIALSRITNNLVSNAIKFTPRAGSVCVTLEQVGDQVKLIVADTGIGIAPAEIPQLFGKFTKCSRPGTDGEASTGLGLSITKELIENHGGKITVTSTEGKGTTFVGFFACLSPKTSQLQSVPSESLAMPNGVRILLVEDNQINILITKTVLSRAGFEVVVVENGQKAVDCFEDGGFDLVLMDTMMPIMDGFEATRKIREMESGQLRTPILALTGLSRDQELEACLAAGMDAYLIKPVDSKQLVASIRQMLAKRPVAKAA